jgi:ribonucleoside-diphosphate reductase alpha chain
VGDRWFVFVQSVEPAGEALTLDLEVEQNHTYLANGMVTHNSRRGANMAVLRVDHPDIEEFITCKTDENAITNFNISVGITDAFMRAVENDEEWELRFPDVLHPAYRNFRGTLEDAERAGIPIRVYKRVRARDLFRKIATQAHHNGEPGVLFLDTANRSNPVPHLYTLEATNPCGEQWLGPFENCCLGSVNLARHVKYVNGKAEVDWEKLRETVEWATRFLDNVVQVNQYVPAVPQLKEAAFKTRRIGLGFMGLADLMYHLRIRYGSEEGQEFAAQIAEFIRYHAMRTSIELARERGPFPAIRGSIYDPEDLKWEPPKPLKPYTRDWGRPPLDWNAIVEGIRRHGIRNAAQNTVAPTGTLSTVAGCEGYGCEPVFALAYIRYVHEAEGRLELRYVSPLFMRALKEAGLDEETRARIIEEVLRKGTCQHIQELPDWIRHTFVVAQDLTPEEHVWMQASIQAFIDNSISKTINFPETATVEDVEKAYLLAWKLGCKGLTVYVAGSRQKEVLETLETKARKEQKEAAMVPAQPTLPQPVGPTVRPRPQKLAGVTYRIATPVGTAFITLNENGEGQPFEVFLNVGKAGSDIAAVAEAIGRLISLLLRLPSPVPPAERLRQVVDQLQGIGGGRALGFGPERVRSLPDGIARVLAEYLAERGLELPAAPAPAVQPALPLSEPHPGREEPRAMGPVGDICPQCGEATLLEQEGCRTCYNCGYSEC